MSSDAEFPRRGVHPTSAARLIIVAAGEFTRVSRSLATTVAGMAVVASLAGCAQIATSAAPTAHRTDGASASPRSALSRRTDPPSSEHRRSRPQHAAPTSALYAARHLTVAAPASHAGYSRDAFGPAWTDDNTDRWGGNSCDTRDDILRRDLTNRDVSNGCQVDSGRLHDPYTGREIHFARGDTTSLAVQIDHVVALSDAWSTGARRMSAAQRVNLANDPLELIAVDGPTNESKGDGDTSQWLPADRAFDCRYVARQVAVKIKYHLWATHSERMAMVRVLSSCPNLALPGAHVADTLTFPGAGSAAPHTRPQRGGGGKAGGSVYYANCDAVRAAGKAPLHRGQPGYDSELDRDGDGVACEP